MSLILKLKSADNLRGRSERVVKATFRGVSQFTKICESSDNAICFDEVLKWNLPDFLEPQEQISIEVYNYNKYLANRLVGAFGMVLQQLVEAGKLDVSDCLLDENNVVTQANINFELTYNPPDPRLTQLIDDVTSETKPLLLVSKEKTKQPAHPYSDPEVPTLRHQRQRIEQGQNNPAFRSVRTIGKMMRFVRQTRRHVAANQSKIAEPEKRTGSLSSPAGVYDDDREGDDNDDLSSNICHLPNPNAKTADDCYNSSQTQDYQVSVTIIEARQLSGVNMNPVVCVQVGDQKKYTSVKESTNCPYYNEYFVFDFHIIASVLLDKMITISVLHSRNILRSGTKIGSFKLDVGTVYEAPDHHFYHKWAVLTDPDDVTGGSKGYVKCDIAVFGKGDKIKVPQKKSNADDDDIESNLLLPNGSPVERQRAKFIVAIYRGEGFPRMNTGIMANVKKAITGEMKDLVDPYVLVSFAGHKGRTSTKKGRYNPVWNEEVTFVEMFPPFCCRVKVQVRNDDVNDDIIATHFLDLASVSNDGMNGFLPTFGPSWVNLYGSFRSYNIVDEYAHLNEGISAGLAFRGRLLISLRVELVDWASEMGGGGSGGAGGGGMAVDVGPCLPVPESYLGSSEEYFLFASIFHVNMIDRRLSDKPISFEISLGNYGNVLDGTCSSSSSSSSTPSTSASLLPPPPSSSSLPSLPLTDDRKKKTSTKNKNKKGDVTPETEEAQVESDPDHDHDRKPLLSMADEKMGGGGCGVGGSGVSGGGGSGGVGGGGTSITEAVLPVTKDKYYYSLPYHSDKPCIHTGGSFEDHKFRLYNTNLIGKMITQIKTSTHEIGEMLKMKTGNPEKRLKSLLESTSQSCSRYLTLISTKVVAKTTRTKLDKERLKLCRSEVESIASVIRLLRPTLNQSNVKDKLKIVHGALTRLKKIMSDPQHALPDVFVWMIQNKKRIAYHRIPSSELIFSSLEDERGCNCGQLQTIVMKTPLKKGTKYWTSQARLSIYLWLGGMKQRKMALEGLPSGYQASSSVKNIAKLESKPPNVIKYIDHHSYQLRAYMYQARGLIGSDDTGLSDPFARVIFGHESLVTRVIDETLNPSWDEMLIFRDVRVYSDFDYIVRRPPEVVVEIFDRDRVGKSEFIGYSMAYPVVKGYKQKYEPPKFPPKLCWYDVYRGGERAGELLAAFELLQLSPPGESSCDDLPPCDLPNILDPSRSSTMPVPRGIRPTLSTHRIEVLFWGVRDLKRIQFMTVEKPRIDVECSGKIISSSVIKSCRKNPNFLVPIKYMDVDLPDNDIYCPPITIRCFDCRNFGRFVLVGNHVIDNIRTFIYCPAVKKKEAPLKAVTENFEFSQQSTLPLPNRLPISQTQVVTSSTGMTTTTTTKVVNNDVTVVLEDEKLPLITKHESIVTIETVARGKPIPETKKIKDNNNNNKITPTPKPQQSSSAPFSTKQQQQSSSSSSSSSTTKRKRSSTQYDDEESEMEGLDWWTKYHASVLCRDESETIIGPENPQAPPSSQRMNQSRNSDANKINQSSLINGKLDSNYNNSSSSYYAAINNNNNNLSYNNHNNNTTTTSTTNNNKNLEQLSSYPAANQSATGATRGDTSTTGVSKSTSLKFSKAANNLVAKLSPKSQRRKDEKKINWAKLKVYQGELESEFNNFKEWLHTYDLYRGKKSNEADDDDGRIVGKFKGAIVIYKLPLLDDIEEGLIDIGGSLKIYRTTSTSPPPAATTATTATTTTAATTATTTIAMETGNVGYLGNGDDGPPVNSLFQGLPSNEPLHVLVRVYVVKAIDLHPADINGKADPYIVIKLGQTTVNDKENYISKQLNPVFGKCFEVEAIFPQDSLLRVQVYDWDLIGADDVIGETVIDLENRYFSRHRATCGLSLQYDSEGYNAWRDPMKPTAILSKLCKDYKLDGPYYQPGRVRINNMAFNVPMEFENEKGVKTKSSDETLALAVLHHWEKMPKVGCKLVVEHVETRPLYHPDKPGMEQGKLEMWVDMFPIDMPAPGPPVDISPRKPKSYELRVIIWNTDDVVLEDDAFFTGEKMSDIYVKGWIKGPEDMQSTDIHYRSLTGEGNFNWRFLFPFEYLVAEEKVVISRKDTVFSWDETETKIPARLNLQVWDADHFSADDFLGAMTFELTQFPRGAKSSKQCTLDMLKTDGSVPQINLFKHKRVKGWWPFYVKVSGEEMELTGKVEAELHLLTAEEAEKHPAGQGRNEPDPLEKPNRPDTSFVWFLNPIKSLKYILWHNYRWLVLKIIIITLLAILIILFFYSLPGYTVKKMLGA